MQFIDKEFALDFAHFANGASITSSLVFVNVATHPIRPALYFYDKSGHLIDAESVVDVTGDLEVTEDGALTVQTEMEPLGELTISTHGRGEVVTGSVTVASDGPIGGVLRFDLPGIGVAGVGASQPVRDAIFPARLQAGGISTAAAIHNPGEEALGVSCRLMKEGIVLEEVEIPLAANGQEARFIQEVFTLADTSDFVGSVRCTAPGLFTGVAVELAAGNRIFTTLPVVPVIQGEINMETPASAPDLVVQTPSVSDSSPNAGESFTLSTTVRNQGNGGAALTTLRYYRSADATISMGDTQVGTDAVSGLSVSGASDESINLTAPSTAGTYYYGACVDPVSGESDTGNNCSSAVRVTVSDSPMAMAGTRYEVDDVITTFPTGVWLPDVIRWPIRTDADAALAFQALAVKVETSRVHLPVVRNYKLDFLGLPDGHFTERNRRTKRDWRRPAECLPCRNRQTQFIRQIHRYSILARHVHGFDTNIVTAGRIPGLAAIDVQPRPGGHVLIRTQRQSQLVFLVSFEDILIGGDPETRGGCAPYHRPRQRRPGRRGVDTAGRHLRGFRSADR